MQDELPLLIQLQSLDLAIDDLNKKAEAFTPQIQKKTLSLESLKTGLKSSKEKVTSFQVKKKELELEADAQEKAVKKHQGELNSLKSNDAYKAMLGEIENAKNAQTKIEDQLIELMQSIENAELAYKEAEKKLKSDESVIKTEIQNLEKQKSDLAAQAASKKQERDAFAETVPAKARVTYETIRQRRGGVAIVPLVNNACTGCLMNVTQNKIVEVKKAKTMVVCDSCMRILYLKPEDKPAEAAPAQQPATVPQQ